MLNNQHNYERLYELIRRFYLASLPRFAIADAVEIVNSHLASTGSTLKLDKDGSSEVSTGTPSNELEKFIAERGNSKMLRSDILDMIGWLEVEGYLSKGTTVSNVYRATDKMVRTTSLDFESNK
ncbi:hypothetical protein [Acinetobacter variabilis]|uniref:hypothetical protein n=1 Tax=Acinetobacter variabilis TaxID=70346 RepID=UPI0028A85850|nr:hypothetical protein [Acinetobacter variabilis]